MPSRPPADSYDPIPHGDAHFYTTRWTVVLQAGGDSAASSTALDQFCQSYYYPIYAFIRRRGLDQDEARDLTQGFFEELLETHWLATVTRRETRFSTLLLTVLNRFLVDSHRREHALKRGGGREVLSLDAAEAEAWFGAEPTNQETPEVAFERNFAKSVLTSALAAMTDAYGKAGREEAFTALSPFLSREPDSGEYIAVGRKLDISRNGIAAAVLRLRRDYREFVRQEVAAGLQDKSKVDEEVRHLALALGG